MKTLYIIDGLRTPFCKAGTTLAGQSAADLGRAAVSALMARTGIDPDVVDEVIFGCVCQPADTANIARVIALRAGLPERTPAMTVHRNCASGLESLTTAHAKLCAGQGGVFIVGGTESMSRVPLLFSPAAQRKFQRLARSRSFVEKARALAAFRPSDFSPVSALIQGLTDPVAGMGMAETAELLAREFSIDRAAQDAFALDSHRKAAAARERLHGEITPVFTERGVVDADNGIRPDTTLGALAKLRPLLDRDGTVTAGNSSQITDGAVALLVAGEEEAARLGREPLGRLVTYACAGCDPRRMGLGPLPAIAKTGIRPCEADLVEINEAFAAQTLAVLRQLEEQGGVPPARLNVNGGSIALGHPVGATGARLVLTALRELQRTGGRRALVSLCVGGGQGCAVWLERP